MKKSIFLLAAIALQSIARLMGQTALPNDIQLVGGDIQVRNEDICIITDYNKEVLDNVKWAFNKYWTFGSKITSSSEEADPNKLNKKISHVKISDYEQKGEEGNFYNTRFCVTNMLERPGNKNVESFVFTLSFDNMIRKKENETVIGADKNYHLVANKALVYTMLFCSMAKNYTFEEKKFLKRMRLQLAKAKELKEKLKTTTVLVPQELLDNGITKEAFSGLKIPYQVESSDNIAKRVKEGKNVKNFSELLVIKSDTFMDYVYLVDLETGDLISWAALGGNTITKGYGYIDDNRLKKLLSQLE